jgi:hypothetical protein
LLQESRGTPRWVGCSTSAARRSCWRTGIRTLGGALIGVTTVGGLASLVDRSLSAADAIGKTADKIGVGVEALQELRFAAKASGGEQQGGRGAQGTGEKDALAQMGIALRDQCGNLRRGSPARRWG